VPPYLGGVKFRPKTAAASRNLAKVFSHEEQNTSGQAKMKV
jgi:hypothetical protein